MRLLGEIFSQDYLYLIFITKIVDAKVNVMVLAIITGISPVRTPYKNQRNTPKVNRKYIVNDRSCVCFVLMTWIACGKNDNVVHVAANIPINVYMFMGNKCAS